MTNTFEIDIGRFYEDVYYALEQASDGQRMDSYYVEADTKKKAVEETLKRLKPLVKRYMKQVIV